MKKLVLFLSFLLISTIGFSQWEQLGQDLNGEDIEDAFGNNIAYSGSGDIVAVSAPWADPNGSRSGEVKVFELVNGEWEQLGNTITGENPDDRIGSSLALSDDGQVLAVGKPFSDNAVKIYKFLGNIWQQIGQTLIGQNTNDGFGKSIDMDASGDRIVIGAPFVDVNGAASGAVYSYIFTNNNWEPQGQVLYGDNAGDNFGETVQRSFVGQVISVAATGAELEYIRAYSYDGTNWNQRGQDIVSQSFGINFGDNMEMDNNGITIAISAPKEPAGGLDRGAIFVYKLVNGVTWTQVGNAVLGESNFDYIGRDDITLDFFGEFMAYNSSNYNGTGAVFFKHIQGNEIVDLTAATLFGEGGVNAELIGWSMAFSLTGDRIAIGAPFNSDNGTNAGQVRVYETENILSTFQPISSQFKLYPNPNNGIFNITFPETQQVVTVNIIDLLGRQVVTIDYFNTNNIEVNENLKAGVYLVEIATNEVSETVRILVK